MTECTRCGDPVPEHRDWCVSCERYIVGMPDYSVRDRRTDEPGGSDVPDAAEIRESARTSLAELDEEYGTDDWEYEMSTWENRWGRLMVGAVVVTVGYIVVNVGWYLLTNHPAELAKAAGVLTGFVVLAYGIGWLLDYAATALDERAAAATETEAAEPDEEVAADA